MERLKDKKWIVGIIALVVMLLVVFFAVSSCGKADANPSPSETASQVAEIPVVSESPEAIPSSEIPETAPTSETTGSNSENGDEKVTESVKPSSSTAPKDNSTSNTTKDSTQSNNKSGNTSSGGNTTPSTLKPSATPKPSAPSGHYEKVWVVDKAAYSYQEDVYEEKAVVICNTCGADITNNKVDHLKGHLLNGENSSYRVDTVNVKVGTKTVNVPEQGHWEQVWVAD